MITRDQSALLAPVERDLRLDLFRGIGLWMIFLDHIPHDVVAWLTLRNYGFSDAAEFFVFISGYLVGWIYGPIVAGGWFLAALKRLWRRAADVCRPHHAVPVVHGADRPHRAAVRQSDVRGRVQRVQFPGASGRADRPGDPPEIQAGQSRRAAALHHAGLASPFIVWCLVRRPNLTLAASVVLYVLARWFDWNMPLSARHTWYFNPFAGS